MATYTSNFNFKKPEGTDTINISDLNGNFDTIDSKMCSVDTAQTISGEKVFSALITVSRDDNNLFLKNPNYTSGSIPSSTKQVTIAGKDSGSGTMGWMTFSCLSSTGDGKGKFHINNYNSSKTAELDIFAQSDGSSYVTVPYRSYASASSYDALTKAHVADMPVVHLTGTEQITGNKTFEGSLSINGSCARKFVNSSRDSTCWVKMYQSDTNLTNLTGMILLGGQKSNVGNIAGIAAFYASSGSVSLYKIAGIRSASWYQRVCIVKLKDANQYEIWAYNADGNTGITMNFMQEQNWGNVADKWNVDGTTTSTAFDPTDTSVYDRYSYITE